MLCKRIIPCLDIKDGRVVKGINFKGLKDQGCPVELAKRYAGQGGDELVFLDITATNEHRKTVASLVEQVAKNIFIPLTVGGGIQTCDQIATLLRAGADKVSINSAAIKRPDLISEASERFGSQAIVVAIDVKRVETKTSWTVWTHSGTIDTGIDALDWAKRVCKLGAGEILLTSMDCDGEQTGYDLDITKAIASCSPIPVIASGGAGSIESIASVFIKGEADAALLASMLHENKLTIGDIKKSLIDFNIPMRL